ncbi:hypothetical protein ILUMI_07697, partial [Ignelater luminosus]
FEGELRNRNMSAVTIFVIFALGCLHVTGANEQLSLTDFLLDFLLSLWVPLNYTPSQQVVNTPDPTKREQLISIEKSKVALNNYINHLLRYAEENGGLVNGQIVDTGKLLLDSSLGLPDSGQIDGDDSAPNNVSPPGASPIYLTSSGSPNADPNYIPPNCKPTSYSCDNPVPNQSGHFHPGHEHSFEYHPTHYHLNQLHPSHYHQPFYHPGHYHTHHTLPIGIDGNDVNIPPPTANIPPSAMNIPPSAVNIPPSAVNMLSPAVNNPLSDNHLGVPDSNLPPTGAYPMPPNDPDPTTDFNFNINCDPLDPTVIFNPNLCADLFFPYPAKNAPRTSRLSTTSLSSKSTKHKLRTFIFITLLPSSTIRLTIP